MFFERVQRLLYLPRLSCNGRQFACWAEPRRSATLLPQRACPESNSQQAGYCEAFATDGLPITKQRFQNCDPAFHAQKSHLEENRRVPAAGYGSVRCRAEQRRKWYENCLLAGQKRGRMRSLASADAPR